MNTEVPSLKVHVFRADMGPFEACTDCIALYPGQGPYCSNIPGSSKEDNSVGGHSEQTIEVRLDEYPTKGPVPGGAWRAGETKPFWVSYQPASYFSTSGLVLVERHCAP